MPILVRGYDDVRSGTKVKVHPSWLRKARLGSKWVWATSKNLTPWHTFYLRDINYNTTVTLQQQLFNLLNLLLRHHIFVGLLQLHLFPSNILSPQFCRKYYKYNNQQTQSRSTKLIQLTT